MIFKQNVLKEEIIKFLEYRFQILEDKFNRESGNRGRSIFVWLHTKGCDGRVVIYIFEIQDGYSVW